MGDRARPIDFTALLAIVRAIFWPGDGFGLTSFHQRFAVGGLPPPYQRSVFVITPAFAQATGAGGGADMLIQLVPFLLIFVIMWFLIIRPQQRRAKSHQELIKNVRRGDTVVTSGGLIAKVSKVVDDAELEVEIADGVRVRIVRGMIQDVRSKSEPVKN